MPPFDQPPETARRQSYIELIVILGAMTAFAPLSIDMYLPAFPTLQRAFQTTAGQIQLTLSSFSGAFTVIVGGRIEHAIARLPLG